MHITRVAGAACVLGLVMSASVAQAEKLIVTTNLPTTHWASVQGAEPFMACVTERTANALEFEYYHSGQLASFFQSLDAVNSGLAQVSYIVVSAQSDKLPLTGLTMMPGLGATASEITAATRAELDGDGPIAKEFAGNNIVPLMINVFPPYQMVSRSRPLDTLSALQNTRISSGGGPLLVTLSSLGAVAIETPAADMYLAMQQGTIDGSMISLASIKPYSLQEVIKSASFNGKFGVATGIWSIDSGVWAGLPAEQQAALKECGLKVEGELAAWADAWMQDVRKELEEQGIQVFDYSEEALAEMDEKLASARQDYVSRLTSRGLPAQEALDAYAARLAD
ncbi:TRAP transporter substrate-binding protein DctP [Paracoccus pantotrophus]|uniref:TRAP transporter substrate-binding protein n=1 Tax=Paracoccus pantotrophus TaxID=82367 RepID=UPI0018CC772D|nr:TRAP transporter substrate-binding protein DctP [Paracoccus pantotrophus]